MKGDFSMRNNIRKLLCSVLAAAVLATGVPAAPVFAANASAATVSAVGKSATSATPEQEVTVKKPSQVSCKTTKNSVKVTIKKVAGAAGYQVQYATNKKMTSGKKTVTTKKTTYTVSKLKAKTTYYVRVRSYKIVDGKKVYSKWTSAKKVTTKQ